MLILAPVHCGPPPPRPDRHRLAGVVTVDGQPARRRVALFDRRDYSLIACAESLASDGSWRIEGIGEYPERSLLVVALDSDQPVGAATFNAEVADLLSQVAPTPYVPPAPES